MTDPANGGRGARDIAPAPFTPEPFRSAWWLPGPHAQTVGARLLRPGPGAYERERLELADGDFLDLDQAAPAGNGGPLPPDAPVALVLHGLEGCAASGYVVNACHELGGRGIRAVAMNFRSRGGEPNRSPESYHAGKSDDLEEVLEHVARRWPGAPVAAVGFSLGGNVILKYLGERGDRARERVRAAAAISVPFDLSASAARMERGAGRLYARFFLRSLRRSLRRKAERFPAAYDLEAAERARTIREFDETVTAPVHGFRSAKHYYSESSSGRYLDGIRVPTLLIHSADDPMIPAASVPGSAIGRNPWLLEAPTRRGGHAGFVAGPTPFRPTFWAEREAARFLAVHLGKSAG